MHSGIVRVLMIAFAAVAAVASASGAGAGDGVVRLTQAEQSDGDDGGYSLPEEPERGEEAARELPPQTPAPGQDLGQLLMFTGVVVLGLVAVFLVVRVVARRRPG